MHATRVTTDWGPAWLLHAGGRLVGTVLPGGAAPAAPEDRHPPTAIAGLQRSLETYFRTGRGLPAGSHLADGPEFRQAVYRVVCAIPPGTTLTYREVAARAERPDAARAVGAAMAANRFAPLIPCHRVVGSDGSLRGYAGGIALKQALLAREAA